MWRVYPRVGGATAPWLPGIYPGSGLSPRGRGNPQPYPCRPDRLRSIPAWAGQPGCGTIWTFGWAVYPRVGGATCTPQQVKDGLAGLSPRGRGNRGQAGRSTPPRRSIPAWAGQPVTIRASLKPWPVYPRVGGATLACPSQSQLQSGLSPRGRGNRRDRCQGVGH